MNLYKNTQFRYLVVIPVKSFVPSRTTEYSPIKHQNNSTKVIFFTIWL